MKLANGDRMSHSVNPKHFGGQVSVMTVGVGGGGGWGGVGVHLHHGHGDTCGVKYALKSSQIA